MDHEVLDHPVKFGVNIVFLAQRISEMQEICNCLGDNISKETKLECACWLSSNADVKEDFVSYHWNNIWVVCLRVKYIKEMA